MSVYNYTMYVSSHFTLYVWRTVHVSAESVSSSPTLQTSRTCGSWICALRGTVLRRMVGVYDFYRRGKLNVSSFIVISSLFINSPLSLSADLLIIGWNFNKNQLSKGKPCGYLTFHWFSWNSASRSLVTYNWNERLL